MNFQIINDIKETVKKHEDKKLYGHFIIKFNFYNGEIKNVNFTTERCKVYGQLQRENKKSS